MNTKIEQTSDYSRFKTIVGNRPVRTSHVYRLKKSIEENPHLIEANPVLVNKKWEIIDGQHRFEALKQMDLPISYIQLDNYTLDDVQILNTNSKNWTLLDYAISFASQGNKNYIIYLDYLMKYKLGKTITAQLLMLDKPYTGTLFKTGKLKVVNLVKTDKLIKDFLEVAAFFPDFYNTKAFSIAYLKMWLNSKYKHSEFLSKLSKYSSKVISRNKVMDYVRDFEDVYNTQKSALQSVRFD